MNELLIQDKKKRFVLEQVNIIQAALRKLGDRAEEETKEDKEHSTDVLSYFDEEDLVDAIDYYDHLESKLIKSK